MCATPTTPVPVRTGRPIRRRRCGERGSAQLEFALLLLPLLGFILLILDVSWVIFAQSTIQEAVREGVRVGITATAVPPCATVTCSVQTAVQQYAFGFVKAANVQVTYFSPTSGTLTQVSGAGADVGGNILQVSVSGITIRSMGAILRTQKTVTLGATAADVIESNPSPSSP